VIALTRIGFALASGCRMASLRMRDVGLVLCASLSPCSAAVGFEAGGEAGTEAVQSTTSIDFVSAGCGGGVTGGSTHYRLARDGVLSMERRRIATAPPERMTLRHDARELAARLLARAEREDFPRSPTRQIGGMTCWLHVQAGGKAFDHAWPLGSRPPAPVKEIHAALVEAGQAAEASRRMLSTSDPEAANRSSAEPEVPHDRD
jgi:hypothetical protein